MQNKARGLILLCAGQGSRMGELTKSIPKCLLQVNNKKLVIDYLLEAILPHTNGEIVAVAGFNSDKLKSHLNSHYTGRIKFAFNEKYLEDTNIYSVDVGVSALESPENGYLIVETDLLLEPSIWAAIFEETKKDYSFWVCKSYYSETLTGGIIHTNNEQADAISYQPNYDTNYLGWHKMLGMMSVGPKEVNNDISYRKLSIENSIKQYYLQPWSENLDNLPCKVLQLDNYFAQSFNTEKEFLAASKEFSKYQNN